MDNVPPTGTEIPAFLQHSRYNDHMQYFAHFLKWYNNKDVVPTLEAMQKMIEYYHNKGIVILKVGGTLPFLAKSCLQKSTDSNFCPSTGTENFAGKNTTRYGWTVHSLYRKSSAG